MKTWLRMLTVTIFLLASSWTAFSETENLSGKWRGTITERGRSTRVELSLQDQPDKIEGQFAVLDKTGEDVDQGMSFELQQVKRSGRNLRFVVPLTGKIDDDAVAFDLALEGNYLEGNARELRAGSQALSVIFAKSE